jgi:uncharacterized protein
MDKLQTVIGDYDTFLKQILQEVEDAGFDFTDFVQLDHLCYRVPSLERYSLKKRELTTMGKLLGENQVNGRPISTFKLHTPIMHGSWRVDTIELPAPRAGSPTEEGLEHIEFVLFDSLEDFIKKHPSKKFNMAAADRGVNPDIAFKLPKYTVKFHLLNLATVVYLEKKLGMTDI